MQQQQPQLSQYSPQQSATSSPQQQGDQLGLLPSGLEHGSSSQEQTLSAQQAAVINLTGVGGFMPQQAAVLPQLGSTVNRPGQGRPYQNLQLSPALQLQQQAMQQQKQHIQDERVAFEFIKQQGSNAYNNFRFPQRSASCNSCNIKCTKWLRQLRKHSHSTSLIPTANQEVN
ncbi:hypothetical protein AB205_0141980 [Aquarana catesbeiana]|uniref:Uncharacterized protein n=1 Tax=Aquarana catesbeiana TaxID=8400 RepID=A0A2G9RAP3_AQUCT|nr:hypothetical protein AB205_0141980 [Aquarana catesbeiana]